MRQNFFLAVHMQDNKCDNEDHELCNYAGHRPLTPTRLYKVGVTFLPSPPLPSLEVR